MQKSLLEEEWVSSCHLRKESFIGVLMGVLHCLWDPIGVSDVPEARDEYRSYLPQVFSLLIRRASSKEIYDFLENTATQTMGLTRSNRDCEHSKEVIRILERWRDVVHERHSRDA